jgi:hypothetical protein
MCDEYIIPTNDLQGLWYINTINITMLIDYLLINNVKWAIFQLYAWPDYVYKQYILYVTLVLWCNYVRKVK